MASDVVGPPLVKHELQLEADVNRNGWCLRQKNTNLGFGAAASKMARGSRLLEQEVRNSD